MNKSATFSAAIGAAIFIAMSGGVFATAQQAPSQSTPQAPDSNGTQQMPPPPITPQTPPTGTQPSSSDNGEQNPNILTGCRNARYGEVLVVKGPALKLRAILYNTLGLNDCPQNLWTKLDGDDIKKQEHALGARTDGPRFFTMDNVVIDKTGEMKTFCGIPMRAAATIKLSPSSAREQLTAKPYAETKVGWNTQYTFDQGKPMYELIAPDEKVYVMESYALSVDPTLTEASLPMLGNKLKVPSGWQYRVVTPDHDVVVGTPGKGAHFLQDDLKDTYQRLDAPNGTS